MRALLVVVGVLLLAVASAPWASASAPRVVLAEDFTATW